MKREVGIEQVRHSMCPVGHMLLDGTDGCFGSESCEVQGCGLRSVSSVSFWRLPLIGQLQALARNKGSFDQLRRGQ